jgi:hypothetical protein
MKVLQRASQMVIRPRSSKTQRLSTSSCRVHLTSRLARSPFQLSRLINRLMATLEPDAASTCIIKRLCCRRETNPNHKKRQKLNGLVTCRTHSLKLSSAHPNANEQSQGIGTLDRVSRKSNRPWERSTTGTATQALKSSKSSPAVK